MGNGRQSDELRNQLLFFGAIGASLSHEINNVFAIVGELSGLIEDLSGSADEDRKLSADKRASITGRIANQVERGKTYTKQVNSFSHSPEKTGQEMDAGYTALEQAHSALL